MLICACYFAFFVSFYFMLPILPLYVVQLGGSEAYVGVVVGAFTISSVIIRPFIGRSVDERGKKIFMLAGTTIFFLTALLYNFANSLPLLIALRAFHGFGLAAVATAASAYVADVSPVLRRGEAMGYFGMSANVAMAIGPTLGLFLLSSFNFTVLFMGSAAIALISVFLAIPLPEVHKHVENRVNRPPLFSREALLPSVVVFMVTITYGAIVSFLPLFAQERRIENFALFFTVYSIVLIVFRVFSGRLSDIFGRRAIVIPGLIGLALSMVVLSMTGSLAMLLVVAVLYGLAWGAVQPALMAQVTDLSNPNERGACMATYTSAFDLGIGLGAMTLGFLIQATSFSFTFILTAGFALIGLVIYIIGTARSRQPVTPCPVQDAASTDS